MEKLTFNELPEAVKQLYNKLERIENLLLNQSPLKNIEATQWFGLNELCAYLPDRPKKATVYGWVHNGIIPHHKGGKKLRFLKSEIDAWLKTGRKRTNAEIAAEAETYVKGKGK